MNSNNIRPPSINEVQKYLEKWPLLESYFSQEQSIGKLFMRTYPSNSDLDDVLVKVCVLNEFYSTNILSPYLMAKHIVALNIDEALAKDDMDIVDKISMLSTSEGKGRRFYSFATKYCSHHKPDVYPIYDSFVEKILVYFKKKDNFADFSVNDLKVYPTFCGILMKFREHYGLLQFNLKQIDQYLWQIGKEHFPRKYY